VSQVETTPHEIEGRWKWPDWGRGPYDALSSVMLGDPFEGTSRSTASPGTWRCATASPGSLPDCRTGSTPNGSTSGISWAVGAASGKPRTISARGSRTCVTGKAARSCSSRGKIRVGEVDGVDVEFHTSNIEPDRGLELLPEFFGAVFDHANERIHSDYFRAEPHEASRMWAYERYVRIRREWAEKLSSASVLQKVAHYLSDLEGVKAELHINNNKEAINHQNRLFWIQHRPANCYPATPTGGSSRSTS